MMDDFETRAVRIVAGGTPPATLSLQPAEATPDEGEPPLAEMAAALRTQLGADVVAVVGGALDSDGRSRRGLVVLTADSVIFFRCTASGEERIDRPNAAVLWADADPSSEHTLTLRWRDRAPWRLAVEQGDLDGLLAALGAQTAGPDAHSSSAPSSTPTTPEPMPAGVTRSVTATAGAVTGPASVPGSGWHPDPFGRHMHRWFDGDAWTAHVADDGVAGHDPASWTVVATDDFVMSGTEAPMDRSPTPVVRPATLPGRVAPVTGVERAGAGSELLPTVSFAPAPPVASYPPVPTRGWGLLVAFGLLILGACLLPFASAGGQDAEPIVSDLSAAAPLLALAAASVAAGLAGRAGYDVGLALGGGVVVVFSVVMALFAPLIKFLFDVADAVGDSVSPNVGAFCFVGAVLVGLLVAVPAFASVRRSAGNAPIPVWIGLLGAGGTALYLWATVRPPYDGAAILSGDWYVDSVFVALGVALSLPAVLLLTARTAAAAALLGGVLIFPGAGWFAAAVAEQDSFGVDRPPEFELAGIGLVAALCAAAIGMLCFARRAEVGPHGVTFVEARHAGALAVVIAVVSVGGLVGFANAQDDGVPLDTGSTVDSDLVGDDRLAQRCGDGSMAACDELYYATPVGSDLERFAMSCGDRDFSRQHSGDCESWFG